MILLSINCKSSKSLVSSSKSNKIIGIFVIDAISKTLKKTPDQDKQTYYVSSPGALTELSLVITKFLKHNFDYLVFDSLTSLSIYTKKSPVANFLSSLINKIKETTTRAVFYAITTGKDDELIKQAEMFVDKVIELRKIKGGE